MNKLFSLVFAFAALHPAGSFAQTAADTRAGVASDVFKPTERTIRVNVVAEQTAAGKTLPPLSPDRPVYAAIYDGGFFNLLENPRNIPGIPARIESEADDGVLSIGQSVSAVTMAKGLHAALARRDILPATDGKEASLALAYHWGATRRDSVLLYPAGSPALQTLSRPGSWPYPPTSYEASYFYFVIVTAYDAAELNRGVALPLWRVKASVGSWSRTTLAQALPSLLAAGSDYFGRDFATMQQFEAPLVTLDADRLPPPPRPAPVASPAARAAIDGIVSWTRRLIERRVDPKLDAAPFLAAPSAPAANRPPKAETSNTLKRAGLLPEPNAKPPTISKQDGELIEAGMIVRQTDQGRKAPVPAPGKPIYYVAYDGGFDSATAGVKPPPPAAIARTLRATLASAGYEPATAENRPSVAIVYRLQYGTLGGFTSETRSTGTGNDTTLFSIGTGSAVRLDCTVTISAYDYQDLTRSEPTLLWVTQRLSLPHYEVLRNVDETFLAFVASCGPYFGTSLPGDLEVDWVPVPRRADLTDRTPAFPALSSADPVLDQRKLGEMKRKEQDAMADITRFLAAAKAQGHVRSDGGAWIRGLARANARNPSVRAAISPALARRIAHYLQEKNQLQETLVARTQGLAPGAAAGPVIDAFSAEHARTIAALTLTGEAIRRDVAQAMAEASLETKGKSLDVLLREFAAAIRASKSIPQPDRP